MKKATLFTKIIATALTLMLLMGALTLVVSAYPAHTDYISDSAVILDENTESSIKSASNALFEAKGTRIAVCTVLNTEDKTPAEYATALFTEWKVGNGVLILLVTEADTFYAVQSNSIVNVLTADKLSEILNSTLEPKFAEKEYSAGVLSAANALSTFLSQSLPEGFGKAAEKKGMPILLKILLILAAIVAVVVGGGYALLVAAEKRQAERRRLELEARRRMAREGRGMPPQRRAPSGRPYPQQRPAPAQRPTPAQRPQQPQQRQATQSRPAANAPQRGYSAGNAATIQISTADIRAARGAQNRPTARRTPYTDREDY